MPDNAGNDSGPPPAPGAGSARERRRQLREEVADYVRELIVSGTVKPGDYLRLDPIAEALGVSNTPVREGLLALRSEGFVRLVPRKGFVVAPFTRQDVRDLFWAQAQFAGELAARAASRMTKEQLDELEAIHMRHHEAVAAGDTEEIAELGREFHRAINKGADSNRLALLLNSVVQHLPSRVLASVDSQVHAAETDHDLVLAALRAGAPDEARSAMASHIGGGAEHLIAALEERGVWQAADEPGEPS